MTGKSVSNTTAPPYPIPHSGPEPVVIVKNQLTEKQVCVLVSRISFFTGLITGLFSFATWVSCNYNPTGPWLGVQTMCFVVMIISWFVGCAVGAAVDIK